jgi:hypothetical protein
MKTILISVGPIPSRLDSVKFVTNRFKGGLALKTAESLKKSGFRVVIAAWKFTEIPKHFETIFVDDVVDYVNKVLAFEADAYVLAAAVANLMPSNPYEGKFPSHQYKVGERFQLEFEIAPRLIDEVKKKYPRASLVGYKLFDGNLPDLLSAARHTLENSQANVVFANHPDWAKEKKWVLTQDGACFECSFDEHVDIMVRLFSNHFYKTEQIQNAGYATNGLVDEVKKSYPQYPSNGHIYGTFAVRAETGFFTTTRGKKSGVDALAWVKGVDHEAHVVLASEKATLNAPLLDLFFKTNPSFCIAIHGHQEIGRICSDKYQFPGTDGDNIHAVKVKSGEVLQLRHHGFLVGFEALKDYQNWRKENGN